MQMKFRSAYRFVFWHKLLSWGKDRILDLVRIFAYDTGLTIVESINLTNLPEKYIVAKKIL